MPNFEARTVALTLGLLTIVSSACSSGNRIGTSGWLTDAKVLAVGRGIDSVLTADQFKGAIWAAHVIDLKTGQVVYSHNAATNLVPASNAKLFTTAAALDQMGPDFTFKTTLYGHGVIHQDTLFGDLVVRGSGDPTISNNYLEDPLSVFRSWADSLARHGIRVVTGDVLADDGLFDNRRLGLGWNWDNESSYYSAQISALSFHDNCVDITVRGTTAGLPAELTWSPMQTDYISVANHTSTSNDGLRTSIDVERARGTNSVIVSGSIEAGQTVVECVTVEDPARFAAHVLRTVIEGTGIEVMHRDVLAVDAPISPLPPDVSGRVETPLASYLSPPLSRIVLQINKQSENLESELLLKSLGVYRATGSTSITPGSSRAGVAAIARTLAAAGIDTTYVGHVDGSGLSRRNLVTASKLTVLLRYMFDHPDPDVSAAFIASLPIGGLDGTLRLRYKGDAGARNAVLAKTGTMTFISGLSGYVATASGHPLAFSIICNNYASPTSAVRLAQDAIVNRLSGL